ncbi:hypothetical protein Cni_G24099 [Canna indica]|uniref:BED-type domain-containing protein n=1 Tax=Canna indica TaxID=4628 RepID=A0AAQ3KUN2_9LILI|nr:hypothetical protein Cni_G24099 [Canna indica]
MTAICPVTSGVNISKSRVLIGPLPKRKSPPSSPKPASRPISSIQIRNPARRPNPCYDTRPASRNRPIRRIGRGVIAPSGRGGRRWPRTSATTPASDRNCRILSFIISKMPRPPDIGWQYGTMMGGHRHHVKCNYCHRVMIGGITRFKKHLASKKGEIKGCEAVPKEVREIMAHHLATRKPRKPNKRRRKTAEGTSGAPTSTNYSIESDASDPDMIDARQELLAFSEAEVQPQKTEQQFEVGTSGFFDAFANIQYKDEQDFPPRATDLGWAHGIMVNGDRQKIECKYCHKVILGGGISRLKQHLAGERGNIAPCDQVPDDVKAQMQQHLGFKGLDICSVQQTAEECNGYDPNVTSIYSITSSHKRRGKDVSEGNSSKRKKADMLLIPQGSALTQPAMPLCLISQENVDQADIAVAKFMYEAGIPLSAANSLYFQRMADAIAAAGPGYKMPSYHSLRGKLLTSCTTEVGEFSKELRKSWEQTGCTVIVDRLIDTAGRSIVNFFIYCPKGTMFLKSVDVSQVETTLDGLVDLFESVIQDVGLGNIVHFLSDGADWYKTAGKVLTDKYRTFFWSVCASHSIELMLTKMSQMHEVNGTMAKAKKISQFIYNDSWLLNLLKKSTEGRDLIRPARTPSVTDFLTLHNIFSFKGSLQQMFTCSSWEESVLSKQKLGKDIEAIVFDLQFWHSCERIVKVSEPLIRVLHIAESGEKPSMGYIYDAFEKAKKDIILAFDNQESDYLSFMEIINCIREECHSPLHSAACYLNPSIFYNPTFSITNVVQKGLLDCIETLEPDPTAQDNITKHKSFYEDAHGDFSRQVALRGRESLPPATWWSMFASDYPELRHFAIRILSQTCSITTLKRHDYINECIHSSKNRIENARLNDLGFVHYNLRLRHRQSVATESKGPKNGEYDNLINVDEDSNAGDWIDRIDDPGMLEEEGFNLLDATPPVDPFPVIDEVCNTSDGNVVNDG